jgi:hypothetical protein
MNALQTAVRCVLPLFALGASAAPEGLHLRLHVENDAGRSDVSYTNGLRLEGGWAAASLPPWLGWMEWFYAKDLPPRTVGLVAAQNIYTPSDIEVPDLTPALLEARPYAGWLYAGMYFIAVDEQQGTALSLELDVGWLGEALGGTVQRWWHAQPFIRAPQPLGWDHHIGDELGVRLMLGYRQRLWQVGASGGPRLDFWGQVKTEAGNVFTTASTGGLFRVGWLSGFPPGEAMPSVRGSAPPPVELYLYARLEQKLVIYNGTLQGGWIASSPHFVQPRPFVTSGDYGIHLATFGVFLEGSRVYRGPEQEMVRDYFRWCTGSLGPGDCLHLLEGNGTYSSHAATQRRWPSVGGLRWRPCAKLSWTWSTPPPL